MSRGAWLDTLILHGFTLRYLLYNVNSLPYATISYLMREADVVLHCGQWSIKTCHLVHWDHDQVTFINIDASRTSRGRWAKATRF